MLGESNLFIFPGFASLPDLALLDFGLANLVWKAPETLSAIRRRANDILNLHERFSLQRVTHFWASTNGSKTDA